MKSQRHQAGCNIKGCNIKDRSRLNQREIKDSSKDVLTLKIRAFGAGWPMKERVRVRQIVRDPMKCNAHLYLPWSVIAELVASADAQLPKVKSDPPGVPAASVESLDGGCVLYRLLPRSSLPRSR